MRPMKSATSSRVKALSSESIVCRCRTLAKPAAGSAPTRALGESVRLRLGNSASIALLRLTSASYSASEISGASFW